MSSRARSLSRHSAFTFTCRSRNTFVPKNCSSSCARRGADPLDHLAGAPDHDRLLRLALDDDRAIQPQDAARAPAPRTRSTTTALENGISACVSCSTFSRTISADEEPLGLVGQVVVRITAARLPAAARAARARADRRCRRSRPRPARSRRTRATCCTCSMSGSSRAFATRSILFRTRTTGDRHVLQQVRARTRRPCPGRVDGVDHQRRGRRPRGACRPRRRPSARSSGAAAGGCRACRGTRPARRRSSCTPRIRFRVVCGLSETMASLCRRAVEQRRLAGVRPADERDEAGLHARRQRSTSAAAGRRARMRACGPC